MKGTDTDLQRVLKEHSKVGGWVPCEERYPDTDGYILLSFSNFSVPLVGRYEEDEEGGAFYVGDETESCVSQGIFVNAWQQLPECYLPEEETGDEIKILKEEKSWESDDRKIEAFIMAISALEKQIPMKVNEDDCCPICHTYGKDDNDVEGDYCPNCGQKLDWSE